MEMDQAGKAVKKKIAPVQSEQGETKNVGAEPNKNFGHGSASSAGVGGQIPKEA